MPAIPDVLARQLITAAHMNAVKNSVNKWVTNTDAAYFSLSNLGVVSFGAGGYIGGNVGIGTASPDALLAFAPGVGQKIQWYRTGNNFKFGVDIASLADGAFTTRFSAPAVYTGTPLFQFGAASIVDGTTFSPYLTVHGNGNVGIGTQGPTASLQVASPAGVYPPASLTSGSAAIAEFGINAGPGIAVFNAGAPGYGMVLQTRHHSVPGNPWPLSLNPLGGNVGIGCTPQTVLDVAGVVRSTAWNNPFSGTGVELGYNAGMGVGLFVAYDRDTVSPKPVHVGGNGTTAGIRVGAGGSVGISNANPKARLHLGACATFDNYSTVNTTDWGQNIYYDGEWRYMVADCANLLQMSGGMFTFYGAPSGTPGAVAALTAHVRIAPTGNVGIGRTPSTGKLEIHASADANLWVGPNGSSLMFQILNDAYNGYVPFVLAASLVSITNGPLVSYVPTTAAADGYLFNSGLYVWYDEANNRLAFRCKTSAGVLKTGFVAVS